MFKLIFITVTVVLSGIVNSATARQSDLHDFSDSTAVYQQWLESLPDSAKASSPADSLKSYFKNCFYRKFTMPIFTPDNQLTESMPQLKPPKVDEKMIIPQFKKCQNKTQPL